MVNPSATGQPYERFAESRPRRHLAGKELPRRGAAAAEKITVGELLTRIMVAVMEADWQVGGASTPSATRSTGHDLALIERAVTAAVALAGAPNVPVTFRRRANRLLREALPRPVLSARVANRPRLPSAAGDEAAD
jgi:hypothetical protein